MTGLQAVWAFIAGDSKLAPLGVGIAAGLALTLVRAFPSAATSIGVLYVAIIATGLIAGVFERT